MFIFWSFSSDTCQEESSEWRAQEKKRTIYRKKVEPWLAGKRPMRERHLCTTFKLNTNSFCRQKARLKAVADLENFGGGDFNHKTSKIRMSSPKLRVIFRPNAEIRTFFRPKIRWSPKKKEKKKSDFSAEIGNSSVSFRPKLGGLQKKKKKKKVFTKIGSDFFGRDR